MARQELIHIHSNVYDETTKKPKSPDADTLNFGELAINYNDTEPCLFIKKNSGDITKFVDEEKIVDMISTIESAGTTSVSGASDEHIIVTSARSGVQTVYTISGNDIASESALTALNECVGSGFGASSITEVIIENEEICSKTFSYLNDRINELSGNSSSVSVPITAYGSGCTFDSVSSIAYKITNHTYWVRIQLNSTTELTSNYKVLSGLTIDNEIHIKYNTLSMGVENLSTFGILEFDANGNVFIRPSVSIPSGKVIYASGVLCTA